MKTVVMVLLLLGLGTGSWAFEFAAKPYEPLAMQSKRLMTSTYDRYENATGLFAEQDETLTLDLKQVHGESVELIIRDFGPDGRESKSPLTAGRNEVKAKNKGLVYISYYPPDFKTAPVLPVQFVGGGKQNGVFQKGDSNETWKNLLANAQTDHLDLVGKYVHLVYPVDSLKQHCPEKGVELLAAYDSLLGFQAGMMGLKKYNEGTPNHLFGRVVYRGYMFADGLGAGFHKGTMDTLCNPDRLLKNSWGVSHEFGHVNQVRPAMKWVSTTEVWNNIYSITAQYLLSPGDMRLEHERCDAKDGLGSVAGGRFNCYVQSALVRGEQWLCQYGPDKRKEYENGGDHFVKLCPLWQLQLYFCFAEQGNRDLYPDVFHKVRQEDPKGKTNGDFQLAFMRNCIDATRQNLGEFFVRSGLLKPIDKDMDDYSRAQLTITTAQCEALIAYAARYPAPKSPVIYYISANSVEAYKKDLPVIRRTDTDSGPGVTEVKPEVLKVDHKIWQHAVAYETYADKKMTCVVIAGTGVHDNSSTLVPYPAGSTAVYAVAANGKRSCVYTTK